MRIDKPGPPTHLAPWTGIKKKDNCKIKQRKGRTVGPCRAKTPSVHWGNFMVQRFLEAVQTYTLYISMSIFYLPAFHFCFRVSQTATAPAAFELVLCSICCKGRGIGLGIGRVGVPGQLTSFHPTTATRYAYKICFVNKVMPLQTNWTLCPCFTPTPATTLLHWHPLGNRSAERPDDWRNMWLTFEPAPHIDG